MHKSKGFTLIELLVVIAIIAILAAILFPVFAKVREKARQTSCASNEKQLGFAVLQYVQDYDEIYPGGNIPTDQPTNYPYMDAFCGRGWASQVYPYVKSTGVYKCPDDSGSPAAPESSVSYGYNYNMGRGDPSNPLAPIPVSVATLVASTKTVMLCEVTQGSANLSNPTERTSPAAEGLNALPANYATGYLGGRGNVNSAFPTPTGLHTDGANYLFGDGHVKWLRGNAVSSGYTAYNENSAQDNTGRAAGSGDTTGGFAATFSIL